MHGDLLQGGKLYLTITHSGRVDRFMRFESSRRLNDYQPHRVVVSRRDRYVSVRRTGSTAVITTSAARGGNLVFTAVSGTYPEKGDLHPGSKLCSHGQSDL